MPTAPYKEGNLSVWRGKDVLQFIDGLSTNHVLDMKQGQFRTTTFTTSKAKVVDRVGLFHMGEFIAMVSHAPYWPMLTEHFLPRILGQDVQVTTATENNEFFLQFNENGPKLGSFHSSQGVTSGRTNEGITMLIAGRGKDVLVDASIEEFHEWRTKNGVPWQGHEITNKFHPLACGLEQDVHAAKGCYIGQEVLTRMRSRGRTGRKLTTINNGEEVNGTVTTKGESASLAIVRC